LPPGELGPIYGRQWRAFGPDVPVCPHGCVVPGVDQIKRLIDDIRKSPNSRRLIVSAWNPMVVDKVALPSCHCFMQFEVKAGKLSCLVYLRSNDLLLGAPFNIASYALLTHIVAGITGLKVGSLVYTIGNAHIYKSHMKHLQIQISRPNRILPKLVMDAKAIEQIYPASSTETGTAKDAESGSRGPDFSKLRRTHFSLVGYHPLSKIPAPMAV
jgi:thymidylate synthase